MNSLLKDVSVSGIINQGHVYILEEFLSRDCELGPIGYLFILTQEEQILPALDMTMCTILAETYELKQFLGCFKISENCYEFKMFCMDKGDDIEVEYSLYLHRLMTFEEKLAWVKAIFGGE